MQRDTELKIRLAKESRLIAKVTLRDSSSMKIIALVTALFLPATFFAAVFAMPAVQWDVRAGLPKSFWIYLACSAVSTAVVFGVWKFGIAAIEKRSLTKVRNGLKVLG